ncbi:hypothetical protein BDQ17DRAFT_1353906 [Cyathus striatus]|nr:hypothetical protein BDQ17DRAFT_1353906 [Cyathus striatus]
MTDQVAEKSDFLRMYMSSHPQTLIAYAKWFGSVKEEISSVGLKTINSKSMTLVCDLKKGENKTVNINFKPPLADYEAVKPRLLEMKALAQEGLGMIKVPRVTTFKFPLLDSTVPLVVVVLYWYFAPINSSVFSVPAVAMRTYASDTFVDYLFYALVLAHGGESLYAMGLCWKYRTPFTVGVLYILSTFIFGYPAWRTLEDHVRDLRIDSVMKIQ